MDGNGFAFAVCLFCAVIGYIGFRTIEWLLSFIHLSIVFS